MFDFIISTLGLGGISFGILAWFIGIPKLIEIFANLVEILTPLLKGLSQGIVEFVKVIYAGLSDILDNVKTVLTVILIGVVVFLGSILYNTKSCKLDCEHCISELRKEYKFVKRRKPYKPQENILDTLFNIWK